MFLESDGGEPGLHDPAQVGVVKRIGPEIDIAQPVSARHMVVVTRGEQPVDQEARRIDPEEAITIDWHGI
jgi:hypothetical protein